MLQMFCTVRVCKNVIDQTWEKPKLSWKQCLCTRAWPKTLPNLLVTGSPTRPAFSQASPGGSPSWLTHVEVGRIQFLGDVGPKPPSGPCHTGLSSEHLTAWQLAASGEQEAKGEVVDKKEVTVLCNLILQPTTCHLCHILFSSLAGRSSLHLVEGAHTRGRGWEVGSLGGCVRSGLSLTLSWSGQTWDQSCGDLPDLPLLAHWSVSPRCFYHLTCFLRAHLFPDLPVSFR